MIFVCWGCWSIIAIFYQRESTEVLWKGRIWPILSTGMGYTAYVNTVSLNDNTTIATLLSASIHIGLLEETAVMNESRTVKNLNLPAVQKTQVWFLDWVDPLEKGMATNSSILAWEIPWVEEPGRHSPGGHRKSDVTEHIDMYGS